MKYSSITGMERTVILCQLNKEKPHEVQQHYHRAATRQPTLNPVT